MSRNLFRINNGILTLANGSEEIANFDFEGRVLFYTKSGSLHRRSTNNSMFGLGWDGDVRSVTPLSEDESRIITDRCYELARNFPQETLSQEEKDTLSGIASRDSDWLEKDARNLLSLYSCQPIMPPDQSSALYLELTTGCRWNRCSICNSYSGRTPVEKTSEQFAEHMKLVKESLGKGIRSRKGIFLGDSGALDVDQKQLLPILDDLKAEFGLPVFTAFDIFSTPKRKNMIHYQDLKRHGLDRIFVFIESGSYKVVKLFNEKINVTETLNIVNNIKDYGIAVSIVVMAGMGGKKFESDHVEGTANIISQMNLESGDMIFLSPVVEEDDSNYIDMVNREGLGILTPVEKVSQMEALTSAIKESYRDMNGIDIPVPIVKYDLRESLF